VKRDCKNVSIRHKRYTFGYITKMWRMALLIRHNCGERKNNVGHRWSKDIKGPYASFKKGDSSFLFFQNHYCYECFRHFPVSILIAIFSRMAKMLKDTSDLEPPSNRGLLKNLHILSLKSFHHDKKLPLKWQ